MPETKEELLPEVIHTAAIALLKAQGFVLSDDANIFALPSNPRYCAAYTQAKAVLVAVRYGLLSAACERVLSRRPIGGTVADVRIEQADWDLLSRAFWETAAAVVAEMVETKKETT